jgi:glutaredoxin
MNITVYSTENCAACKMLKNYLKDKNVDYTSIMVDEDESAYNAMLELSGGVSSVPQITIGDKHLVGFRKSAVEALLTVEDDFLSGVSADSSPVEVCESCQ